MTLSLTELSRLPALFPPERGVLYVRASSSPLRRRLSRRVLTRAVTVRNSLHGKGKRNLTTSTVHFKSPRTGCLGRTPRLDVSPRSRDSQFRGSGGVSRIMVGLQGTMSKIKDFVAVYLL